MATTGHDGHTQRRRYAVSENILDNASKVYMSEAQLNELMSWGLTLDYSNRRRIPEPEDKSGYGLGLYCGAD